ncbi:transcriptional regulator, XRE family protein (plasmid) [Streptomyces sp. AM 4-1-1]|uniref:transcriptional regulator, XRE family protein n=1 Tax=Streptomyces sp. AM 4-1-1 TaxID=3028710 RepID=UPI0023B8B79F|nr:transcriptional regulator, XRE family protein [Streptomyces sp. AM 4-1-1]WEH37888.1 transcriptional regulator, XRE family protein [Streptomyces sp. AM 4-1-1]
MEHLFGVRSEHLFSPAPKTLHLQTPSHDRDGLSASLTITENWSTSRLFMPAGELPGSWEMVGRQALDRTASAVAFRPAIRSGSIAQIDVASTGALDRFLQSALRGFLVGVDDRESTPQLFVTDTANARRARATSPGRSVLELPAAHVLDDLTYRLLWSLVQFDDGLLADDSALAQEHHALDTYLALPRSAPSRMAMPDLTTVGTQWLGSSFCAQHIMRRLDGPTEPPVFWTREQTGEQAAAWLWFQHKVDYLRTLSSRFPEGTAPMSRAFCIPESEVSRSDRYERILLLLAISLMELQGIRVDVLSNPEYSEMDGFALIPGQRAAVANWTRTEAIWAVDTVTQRPALREYREAAGEAQAHSVMRGPDPQTRLRALAGYLKIDWAWLIGRCRELRECGTASIVRPRSRHLSVEALDEVFHFFGSLAPDR